jgi:hypothetical protein
MGLLVVRKSFVYIRIKNDLRVLEDLLDGGHAVEYAA